MHTTAYITLHYITIEKWEELLINQRSTNRITVEYRFDGLLLYVLKCRVHRARTVEG